MNILVINSGSSSIKFSLFRATPNVDPPHCLFDGQLSGIGTPDAALDLPPADAGASPRPAPVSASTPADAIHLVLDSVTAPGRPPIEALGYRVVHPGPKLTDHVRITPEVLDDLKQAVAFAPLHDPSAIDLIQQAMARFPAIPHYACFDTIFHQTIPPEFSTYPIPLSFRDQGVHRYGFHGLSCESVVFQLNEAGIRPQSTTIAHLGSGSSVTALIDGRSVDTSMGLTPTGGVVMGTRPGDLDPGLLFYLLRQPGASVDSVEHMLNHDAGLKALDGTGDMRKVEASATSGDQQAELAFQIFTGSIRRAIGGMAALHGLDTLVFTGGIGEHDARVRQTVADHALGTQPQLDPTLNQAKDHGLRTISSEASSIPVYVVPAEEDLMIARHVARMAASQNP